MHRVILAGGGTGGHVYPAAAMGDALRGHGHAVAWYGEETRLEGRVAPERGYRFRALKPVAFPRSGWGDRVRFPGRLVGAVAEARRMLQEDGATLVLGVGGYVMAPTVFAAWTLGIPSVLHESNVAPGLANRACARVADLVLLTWPETARHLPGATTEVVGCPVNPKVLHGDRVEAARRYGLDPARRTLLVVGGSLGAATINEIGRAVEGEQVLHLTGPKYFDASWARPGVVVRPYEDRMGDAYAVADLVVARAGSSTLAELCAVGKPSVLVPSPNVTDNHQEANARGLEAEGAAVVWLEGGLVVSEVVLGIRALLADELRLARMAAAARRLGKPEVAERVASLLGERFPS